MSLFRFMDNIIGEHSYDWSTAIIDRKLHDLKIRKWPNTIGISLEALEILRSKGCRLILIRVYGKVYLKTDPDTWIQKGIRDRLTPEQELHSFLSLNYFRAMSQDYQKIFNFKIRQAEAGEDLELRRFC